MCTCAVGCVHAAILCASSACTLFVVPDRLLRVQLLRLVRTHYFGAHACHACATCMTSSSSSK